MAAKRKTKHPTKPREDLSAPSKWRAQHGDIGVAIRVADPETGTPIMQRRCSDTLGLMLVKGSITQPMHDAGQNFRATFRIAALDGVRTTQLLRIPGSTSDSLTEGQAAARQRVAAMLSLFGGADSAGGSCLWHVLGLECSLREWATRQGWSGRYVHHVQAQGILLTALGVLAVHYGLQPKARDPQASAEGTWDQALLRDALASVQAAEIDLAALGFSADELAGILAAAGDVVSDGDAPEALPADTAENPLAPVIGEDADDPADAEPEAPRQAVSRPGDLWLMGAHRLLCGDSTDAAAVARVMESDRAAMLFTSPPCGNQRAYTTGGVTDWDALMRGVFQHLDLALRPDGQALINLGLIHRENEWQLYWEGWLEWMRAYGWRRFGLYTWDQGPGLPGDWNGRLAPAFELVFHFNRMARQANKIIPCKWAGTPNKGSGLRAADGEVKAYTHIGQPVQEMRIPDAVLRITRHKGRGIETEHPAVFPVALPDFLMRAYTDAGAVVFEPFAGSGTTLIAGERTGRVVRGIALAPAYVDLAIARWRMLYPDKPVTLSDDGRDYDVAAARAEVADAA